LRLEADDIALLKRRWDWTDRGFKAVQWTAFIAILMLAWQKTHALSILALIVLLSLLLVWQIVGFVKTRKICQQA
jgi:hypothetical protein